MSRTATDTRPRKVRGRPMVIFEDVPSGYDWGWFSREDPRMHLQLVSRKHWDLGYRLWLERDGRRVFEPEPRMPAKIRKALEAKVSERRGMVEAEWIAHMMHKNWLELHVANPIVTLIAYPRFGHRFVRILDLREDIGDPETLASVTPRDVVFNKKYAVLELFPQRPISRRPHIRLESILWT